MFRVDGRQTGSYALDGGNFRVARYPGVTHQREGRIVDQFRFAAGISSPKRSPLSAKYFGNE
jgi:hypothetical protein